MPEAEPGKQIVFLMGPTASGKTDLAIELCRNTAASLISVDSALVYRGMDIGTAKPDAATLRHYPHRLVGIRDPASPYSASDFVRDAWQAIEDAHSQGRLPILVGGTMMYFKALREGLQGLPAGDPQIRAKLERRAGQEGWPALHAELMDVDPETAARLHPNHGQRILRALEVHRITGRPLSHIHATQGGSQLTAEHDLLQLAIMPRRRETLYQRIEERLEKMFESGFVDEVRALYERDDLHGELPSIRAVGYQQLWSFFEGKYDLGEAVHRSLVATRHLAKRQLTWLRSWPELTTLYTDDLQGRTLEDSVLALEVLKILGLKPS